MAYYNVANIETVTKMDRIDEMLSRSETQGITVVTILH